MTLFAESLDLRPYQQETIDRLREAVRRGSRRPLLVLPTGAGKTVIAAEVSRRHLEQGSRVLFLAPRRELIYQASEKLTFAGLDHGVVLAGAGVMANPYAPMQVAGIDTVLAHLRRHGELPPELTGMSLVIIDEAHLAITPQRVALLDHWPNALRIGLTATPTRKDGAALGMLFDTLVQPITVAQLTDQDYLVPARYFSVSEPDLQRIKVAGGDYSPKALDAAVNKPKLIGDVVSTWLALAPERRTIVFCASVGHSAAMAEAFQRVGVAAEHVDGGMTTGAREQIIARYRRGDIQVLTNCFVASYGFDAPETGCIVLARPTRSLMLHLQMIGRGLRISEGKTDCLVLDHAGNVHRHGFAADDRHWTLDGTTALADRAPRSGEAKETDQINCPECPAVFSGARTCPECGHYVVPRGRTVTALDGELVELGERPPEPDEVRAVFYAELLGYAASRGYKPGWAAYKFKERYDSWPKRSWLDLPPVAPTTATLRWIKSRRIAWAKSSGSSNRAAD